MILYIIPLIMGLILGYLFFSKESKFDKEIMFHLKKGSRVIVCIDNSATIFEMIGNRIRITKAISSFSEEPIELPVGVANELNTSGVDLSGSDQSGNYHESGMGD